MLKAHSSRPGYTRPIRLRMVLPVLAMAILPWAADALAGAAPAAPAATAPKVAQSPQPQAPVTVPANVLAGSQGFADLAERLLPTVVNISTSQTLKRRPDQQAPQPPQGTPFDDFFKNFTDRENRPRRVQSLGSGFIIDAAGYVV